MNIGMKPELKLNIGDKIIADDNYINLTGL